MPDSKYIAHVRRRKRFWNNVLRVIVQLFVWSGAAVLYYFAFSIFFDTPVEYRLKHSTDRLRQEYEALAERYDSLNRVMENIVDRDRNVFRILFEADPYDFEEENSANRWTFYESLLSQSTVELQRQFARQLQSVEQSVAGLQDSYDRMSAAIDSCAYRNRIPAIQPIINKQLTLLTASYGMRINPFQKVLRSHRPTVRSRRCRAATARRARPSSSITGTATKRSTRIWAGSTSCADSRSGAATSSPCPETPACRWRPTSITRSAATACASTRSTTSSWNSRPTTTGA